jgi:hypothetical protein
MLTGGEGNHCSACQIISSPLSASVRGGSALGRKNYWSTYGRYRRYRYLKPLGQCSGSLKISVADPGCLSRIPDAGSDFFHPGSRVKKIPGSASKNLSIFTQKIVSKLSEYDPNPSRIQGSKGTRSRIRNTAKSFLKIRIREANNLPLQNLPGHFSGHLEKICSQILSNFIEMC